MNNDGQHSVQEVHGSIGLKAGKHSIAINYFQVTGEENLQVSYSANGIPKMPVPDSELYRDSIQFSSVNTIYGNKPNTFLNQNFPNPALQSTRIEFGVKKPGKVVITLYHIDGTQVKTLFQGNITERNALNFDANTLPAGMYIYKMMTDNAVLARTMLIIK